MAADPISVAQARAHVLRAVSAPLPAEEVALDAALGRVLAEDVRADEDLPPFRSSAMDGYAALAGPAEELPVVGESRAGRPAERALGPGEAMRISTGALVPAGAETVVPVERTEPADGAAGERIRLPKRAAGANVRQAGEDLRAGELALAAGTELGPAEVAVLAAVGRAHVRCARRPLVAVLVTGDELVPPGEPLHPGQIRDSNAYALVALARRAGADVVDRAIVRDEPETTRAALGGALDAADVVCVSGGVSVGPHDHVRPALADLGVEERFWRVALKPGKPVWFGERARTLVFGLPGNPVSAMVTFHLFARPALRLLQGASVEDTRARAVADAPLPRRPARDQVIRCRLRAENDGWHVEPTKEQGSHVLSSMLDADAFALVPRGEGEIPAGGRVEIEIVR